MSQVTPTSRFPRFALAGLVLAALLPCAGLSATRSASAAPPTSPPGRRNGHLVIEMKPGASPAAVQSALDGLGWKASTLGSQASWTVAGLGCLLRAHAVGAMPAALDTVSAMVATLPDVRAVEADVLYTVGGKYGGEQSQMPIYLDELTAAQMRRQSAYSDAGLASPPAAGSGTSVVVAVLDGGFVLGHETLVGRCAPGTDVLDGDSDPQDAGNGIDDDDDGHVDGGVGHGSGIASLVALAAPDARIVPIRVLDDEGAGTLAGLAQGLREALAAGAQVVNCSMGSPEYSAIVDQALAACEASDVLVVVSAGNTGDEEMTYPATSPRVLAVGGLQADGQPDPDSSYGTAVDLSTHFEVITSFGKHDHAYARWFGTSFSAALMSAAAARVLTDVQGSPLAHRASFVANAAPHVAMPAVYQGKMGSGRLDARPLLGSD